MKTKEIPKMVTRPKSECTIFPAANAPRMKVEPTLVGPTDPNQLVEVSIVLKQPRRASTSATCKAESPEP